ncbi:uncharacterized protein LOC102369899 [Alligator sinensis]|uniref:Uncharacterized protein LOC102369899 n=1 Tax=Alligator sinensis TaxID=38654 RepID=A0A3Q0GH36_ALLSI|nr:uncharacterized protein LOC102369899 [Alligator sinensis]
MSLIFFFLWSLWYCLGLPKPGACRQVHGYAFTQCKCYCGHSSVETHKGFEWTYRHSMFPSREDFVRYPDLPPTHSPDLSYWSVPSCQLFLSVICRISVSAPFSVQLPGSPMLLSGSANTHQTGDSRTPPASVLQKWLGGAAHAATVSAAASGAVQQRPLPGPALAPRRGCFTEVLLPIPASREGCSASESRCQITFQQLYVVQHESSPP